MSYPVERFELRYQSTAEGLPDLDEILDAKVTLGVGASGYVAPTASDEQVSFRLRDVPSRPNPVFDAGALLAINEQIVAQFNRSGVVGVLVAPDSADIDAQTGADLRGGDATLTLLVAVARVREVRTRTVRDVSTFAVGNRVPEEEAVNSPIHSWIRSESPIGPSDPLRGPALDDFSSWLSRHPGRRVRTNVLPARDKSGQVDIEYEITESKPWFAYFNYSNTGTDSTTVDRQRFGFSHNQVSGHDDILRIEYVTGNFEDVHGVFSTYQAPIPFTGRKLRGEIDFSWNQFDSSEFGSGFESAFEGEQWEVGGRLAYPVFSHGRLFVDAFAGFRFQHIELDQLFEGTLITPGESDFFYPTVGLRVERFTPTSALDARMSFDWSVPRLADTEDELSTLGRLGAERSVEIFRWDASYSFFLEPLLFPEEWNDPSSPFHSTLAHEIFLWVRGQATLDDRLIPQEQAVAGGLYTVRGYDQSILAGDGLFNLTLEYRLHVPRLFRPSAEPVQVPVVGNFALVPRHEYGFADWDFILRAFFDTASTKVVNPIGDGASRFSTENGQLMQSAGVGAELRLKQNINIRFDWGIALRGVDLGVESADAGDSEFHISATILY